MIRHYCSGNALACGKSGVGLIVIQVERTRSDRNFRIDAHVADSQLYGISCHKVGRRCRLLCSTEHEDIAGSRIVIEEYGRKSRLYRILSCRSHLEFVCSDISIGVTFLEFGTESPVSFRCVYRKNQDFHSGPFGYRQGQSSCHGSGLIAEITADERHALCCSEIDILSGFEPHRKDNRQGRSLVLCHCSHSVFRIEIICSRAFRPVLHCNCTSDSINGIIEFIFVLKFYQSRCRTG